MEKTEKKENRYGLIGKNIAYSFSQRYFTEKFEKLGLNNHSYENFDLDEISEARSIIQNSNIRGLNVTIPYKEEIIPLLDKIDPEAAEIGAVNTIKISRDGCQGFNTDVYGFRESLVPLLEKHHNKALILGTGGASKAIAHVLKNLGISFIYVSRRPMKGQLTYNDLKDHGVSDFELIINSTPLGTYPDTLAKPDIPYNQIGKRHLLFDLIYNPAKTSFLKEGEQRGATIKNGLQMLQLQAEKAWLIWNS